MKAPMPSVAIPRAMVAEARAENEACEAVCREFEAFMMQNGIAAPIVKLAHELGDRIALRRLLAR